MLCNCYKERVLVKAEVRQNCLSRQPRLQKTAILNKICDFITVSNMHAQDLTPT